MGVPPPPPGGCNHVTRRPCWWSTIEFFSSNNLRENRVQFLEERNAFVLDHQDGRREVTWKPAIRGTNSYSSYYWPARGGKGGKRDSGLELGLGYATVRATTRSGYVISCIVIEKTHIHFCKMCLGLKKRSPNVASRNELGRLSPKFTNNNKHFQVLYSPWKSTPWQHR